MCDCLLMSFGFAVAIAFSFLQSIHAVGLVIIYIRVNYNFMPALRAFRDSEARRQAHKSQSVLQSQFRHASSSDMLDLSQKIRVSLYAGGICLIILVNKRAVL
jgi:hypothetical protein